MCPYKQHGDKYLSQRKPNKAPFSPCQVTSEDSASLDTPPPLTPPYSGVWRFLHHLFWEYLAYGQEFLWFTSWIEIERATSCSRKRPKDPICGAVWLSASKLNRSQTAKGALLFSSMLSYRLATSRLAGFFFSKPSAEGASELQKQKETERRRRERVDLSALPEILSHDVILPRFFTFLKFQWAVLKLKSEITFWSEIKYLEMHGSVYKEIAWTCCVWQC